MSNETLLDLKLLSTEPLPLSAEVDLNDMCNMPESVLLLDKQAYQVMHEEHRLMLEALNALPGGKFIVNAIKGQAIGNVCSGKCDIPMIPITDGYKP